MINTRPHVTIHAAAVMTEADKKKVPPAFINGVVLVDRRLNDRSKLIYGIIDSLFRKKRSVYVSNRKLAEWIGVSGRSIQRSLEELEQTGYIKRQITRNDAGRVISRIINMTGKKQVLKLVEENEPDSGELLF
jgi:DNA-binding MarR family transcriptional regulator